MDTCSKPSTKPFPKGTVSQVSAPNNPTQLDLLYPSLRSSPLGVPDSHYPFTLPSLPGYPGSHIQCLHPSMVSPAWTSTILMLSPEPCLPIPQPTGPSHTIFNFTSYQTYLHTPGLDQEVHLVYQPSSLYPPDFISSKSFSRSNISSPNYPQSSLLFQIALSIPDLETIKQVHMPRSPFKNINNMREQAGTFSPISTCPIEMFASENCLNEPQDTEFKRTVVKLINKFSEFKEDTKK